MRRIHRGLFRRQAGFTVAEMLVSMVVLVEVILVSMFLFDFNARVTRVQTSLSNMQQSLRASQRHMVRVTRMAGRGGLPASADVINGAVTESRAFGGAVDVVNNAGGAVKIAANEADSPEPVEDTDVLIVRGVINTPVYSVLTNTPGLPKLSFADAQNGTLIVDRTTASGANQDFSPIQEAIDNMTNEALVIISATGRSVFAVVELKADESSISATQATLEFRISGSTRSDAYRQLWTLNPAEAFPVQEAAFVGILEEYRYYVRKEYEVPGDPSTPLSPRLAEARLFPNTGLEYSNGSLALDIADDVVDLQVALGFDTINAGGQGRVVELRTGVADDWLFNYKGEGGAPTAEDFTAAPWQVADGLRPPGLSYVRISTLARVASPDRDYEAPQIDFLEDHTYSGTSIINDRIGRMYRRRSLETTVDLRNL